MIKYTFSFSLSLSSLHFFILRTCFLYQILFSGFVNIIILKCRSKLDLIFLFLEWNHLSLLSYFCYQVRIFMFYYIIYACLSNFIFLFNFTHIFCPVDFFKILIGDLFAHSNYFILFAAEALNIIIGLILIFYFSHLYSEENFLFKFSCGLMSFYFNDFYF